MTGPRNTPGVIHLRTHAKLNLFLRVVGRRPDGYHELESIFHGVDLADEVTVASTDPDPDSVEVAMAIEDDPKEDVPAPRDNLVFKVQEELRSEAGPVGRGLRIDILKRIPLGSGLGGGSSNAAGTLVALNELWTLGLDHARMVEVAERIGSDVPYFLHGGTALAADRGGELKPLPARQALHFVLGLSSQPLSTRAVYERWDEVGGTTEASSAPMAFALGAGDVAGVAALLHNDLEAPAATLRPDLPLRKARLVEAGALGAGLSGSGPTLFGVASDVEHARAIAARVTGDFDRVVTVASTPRAVERVT